MAWVQMFLDFLQALIWPAVVVGLLIGYKKQVGRFLDEVTDVAFPGGSLKRKIKEGDEKAIELKDTFEQDRVVTEEAHVTDNGKVIIQKDVTVRPPPASARAHAPTPQITTSEGQDDALQHLDVRIARIDRALSDIHRDFEPDPQARVVKASRALLFAVFETLPYIPTGEDILDLVFKLSKAVPLSERLRKSFISLQSFAREVERGETKVSDVGANDYVTTVTEWLMDYMSELQGEFMKLARSDDPSSS